MHHAVKVSFAAIRLMPAKSSALIPLAHNPKCLAYRARNASGFFDLKTIPGTPRTRAITHASHAFLRKRQARP